LILSQPDSRVSGLTSVWFTGCRLRAAFRLRVNAARLKSFVQSAGVDGEELLAGIANGSQPAEVTVGGLGELLEIEGRPKWRLSGSVNWEKGPVEVGIYGQYTGKVWDTSVVRDVLLVSNDPNANFFRVKTSS
jgi:hypothetical protein